MRRNLVQATAALIAALSLAAVPEAAGSSPPAPRPLGEAAVLAVTGGPGSGAGGQPWLEVGLRSAGRLGPAEPFVEPGDLPDGPPGRPALDQPAQRPGFAWKPGRYRLTGYATFYDNGTTAMRLPRGTVVRVCGVAGCLERIVTDYGPANVKARIVDLYRPDFFRICGCEPWSGTTHVTVHVY